MAVFTQDLTSPQVIFLIIFAYLLGSIPVGFLLSKWFANIDPRLVGSGNIGATNVARAGGFRLGLTTFFLDVTKGALPVLLAMSLHLSIETQAVLGLITVLGHCFPVWLNFKGGKGVATGLGALLILSPAMAAIAFIAFSLGYGIGRQVAVGSMVAAFTVLGCNFFLLSNGFMASILVIMSSVIVLCHQNNIRSFLKNKKEG